jgi:hypothetical protein
MSIKVNEENSVQLPTKISEKLIVLFRDAVNTTGSFVPEENLMYFEESLSINESRFAWPFFNWINENNKTFGHNLPDVYQDFRKDAGLHYIADYWIKNETPSC